jgi:flagellar FliL protein
MGLAVVNMVVVVGAGLMIQSNKKKEAAAQAQLAAQAGLPTPTPAIEPEAKTFVAKVIPLETLIVNLAGNSGRRIAKVNIELELEGENAPQEFQTRQVQIRDRVIVILSGRTYEEMLSKAGKDELRIQIKEGLNELLSEAQVKTVYFTDIIYN